MLRLTALVIATVAAVATVALAGQYPTPPASCYSSQSGRGSFNCIKEKPATIPVYDAAPVFVRSVPNGLRYQAGSGNDTIHIAHLYSDTDDLYEMGVAFGQLFPKEMDDMFNHIEPWLVSLLENAVTWAPAWLCELVIKYGAPVALDFIADVTANYTPVEYIREWEGMAAGANCSVQRIKRVSLFPQISKAACTLFLAHDKATRAGTGFHFRGLDFDPTSMVANFASVVFYHYKTKPQLANFAWVAMTGVLTGMNDVPITVGEKKWGGHSSPYLGIPYGLPWMQMLRRALEFNSIARINDYITVHDSGKSPQPNTVSIHTGFTDQKSNKIIAYEVGYNFSKSFQWNTQGQSATHKDWPGLIIFEKNSDPHTTCPLEMITAQYGSIDAEWMSMYYSVNDRTGDTQSIAFDLANMKAWVANSRKTGSDGPLCAYYRQRNLLDMKALFAQKQQ